MYFTFIIDGFIFPYFFINVDVPVGQRLNALQAAVMLLPDENRQVLQSLLLFLYDMAQHSSENQVRP